MDWYWWLAVAVVGIVLIRKVVGNGQRTLEPDDELAFLSQQRERQGVADQEVAKVVKMIEDLSVVPPNASYSNQLSRPGLYSSVSKFMMAAGLLGMQTDTKMLHVVMSPTQIAAFVKLRPTHPQTAVREFIRIGESEWAFRTRQVADMDEAVRAAEEASERADPQR